MLRPPFSRRACQGDRTAEERRSGARHNRTGTTLGKHRALMRDHALRAAMPIEDSPPPAAALFPATHQCECPQRVFRTGLTIRKVRSSVEFQDSSGSLSAERARERCAIVRRHSMTRFSIVETAAILSVTLATPAFAQSATRASGACPLSSRAPVVVAAGVTAPAPSARPLPAGCETTTRPWSAPVGHRQPQAADVPPSDRTLDQENANVDRIVRGICRGC